MLTINSGLPGCRLSQAALAAASVEVRVGDVAYGDALNSLDKQFI